MRLEVDISREGAAEADRSLLLQYEIYPEEKGVWEKWR